MAAPKISDPREENILPWDIASLIIEYDEGKVIGESCGIPQLDKIYTMKPGTLSALGGWANSGKSTILMFKNLVRAIKYKTKFCWWSHEMINSIKHGDKMVPSASDLQADLIHMYTGKVPYKHWKAKYGKEQMTLEEYKEAAEFLEQYFVFLNLKDRTYNNVMDNFQYCYDELGCTGFVVDPFKNMLLPENGRDDRMMEQVFQDFRDFAMMTNSFVEFIAHPKSVKEVKKNNALVELTPNMWLGGSAWENSMDQLLGAYRKDGIDPWVTFTNFKQKKQHLTNEKGAYHDIEYDFFQNRYYFNGVCPIDGSMRFGRQGSLDLKQAYGKNERQAKQEVPVTDDPPF